METMSVSAHNPAEYNGYKVYGRDGGQITLEMADSIQKCIEKVDIFTGVKKEPFAQAVKEGSVNFVPQELLEKYLDQAEQYCSAWNIPESLVGSGKKLGV